MDIRSSGPLAQAALEGALENNNLVVGVFSSDETILVEALRNRGQRKFSQVLLSLDKVNHHGYVEWMIYFVDHCVELLDKLDIESSTRNAVVGEPSRLLSASTREPSSSTTLVPPAANAPSVRNRILRSPSLLSDMYTEPQAAEDAQDATGVAHDEQDPTTGDIAATDSDRAPSQRDRSQSPVPPRKRVAMGLSRYRFTSEDIDYMTKVARRMVRENPTVSTNRIITQVSKNTPHHPAISWATFLRKNSHYLSDVYAEIRAEAEDRDAAQSRADSEGEDGHDDSLPQHLGLPSDSDPDNVAHIDGFSDSDDSTIYDGPHDASEDEEQLGPAVSRYGGPEERVLARWIITHHDWHEKKLHISIRGFAESYPNRSFAAWKEYYRGNKDSVDRLARRMRLYGKDKNSGSTSASTRQSTRNVDRSTSSNARTADNSFKDNRPEPQNTRNTRSRTVTNQRKTVGRLPGRANGSRRKRSESDSDEHSDSPQTSKPPAKLARRANSGVSTRSSTQ